MTIAAVASYEEREGVALIVPRLCVHEWARHVTAEFRDMENTRPEDPRREKVFLMQFERYLGIVGASVDAFRVRCVLRAPDVRRIMQRCQRLTVNKISALEEIITTSLQLTLLEMFSADSGTCPRCQAWEKEGYPVKNSSGSKPSIRGTGSTRTPLLFKREPSRIQILSKYSHAALRAGAIPAMLPFHSRLFRRTHHSTRQAKRWVVQNLSKTSIKANHPRCDLCTPCAPCLLPYWGYQLSLSRPAVRNGPAERRKDEHEDSRVAEHARKDAVQPTRSSAVAHHVIKGHGSDHTSSSPHYVEAMEKHRSTPGPRALHSLCSLRSDGDRAADSQNPRTKDCHSQKHNLSCSLKVCDSCDSWQLLPSEEEHNDFSGPRQVCSLLQERCSAVGYAAVPYPLVEI